MPVLAETFPGNPGKVVAWLISASSSATIKILVLFMVDMAPATRLLKGIVSFLRSLDPEFSGLRTGLKFVYVRRTGYLKAESSFNRESVL